RRRSVDLGGLLQVPRHLGEEARQHVHTQRQREREIRDDQRLIRAEPVDVGEELEKRSDQRDSGEHARRENEAEHRELPPEVQPRDSVRTSDPDDHREHGDDSSDDHRVDQGTAEVVVALEDRLVVVEGDVLGEQSVVVGVVDLAKRGHDHPVERCEAPHNDDHHAEGAPHGAHVEAPAPAAAHLRQFDCAGRGSLRRGGHAFTVLAWVCTTFTLKIFTRTNATRKMNKNVIVDSAAAAFWLLRSSFTARMDSVVVWFAPCVRMYGRSKMRSTSRTRNSTATRSAGLTSGSVMRTKRCHAFAPSTRADSYSSSRITSSPATPSKAMSGEVFRM